MKLRPAEEWAKEGHRRRWNGFYKAGMEGLESSNLHYVRDIQRNALEAAATAIDAVAEASPSRRAARWDCAQLVRDLIPENPAPTAGTDEEGGGAK